MYAWMFYQLPYGIFAVALATATFTELSESAGRKEWERFTARFRGGLRATALIIIPMAALLIALATPLITLYRAGRFTASDIPIVAEVLVWWAAGLFFFASYMFVLKTFYSLKDTATPAVVNLGLTVVQIALYAMLTTGFAGWAGLGLKGIPIADGIFFLLSVILLGAILSRRIGGFDAGGIVWLVVRVALASLVGAAAAIGVAALVPNPANLPLVAVATVIAAGLVGLTVTYATAWAFRISEVPSALSTVRRTLQRRS